MIEKKDEFKISFLDKQHFKVTCEIELKHSEKGLVFSMCGEYSGSMGQCFDEVKPRTNAQKKLIELWHKYHLNNMNAGTPEQTAIIRTLKKYSYEEAVKLLKKKRKYEVTLPDGSKYRYGSSWLLRELPINFEQDLKLLIETIVKEEEAYKNQELTPEEREEIEEKLSNDRIQALKKSLDLEDAELLDVSTNNQEIYTVQGVDYWVLTEEEAHKQAREYLDKDLWIDAVKNNRTTDSFEEWQDWVIDCDGFASSLNSYDGSQDDQLINDVWYFIMRC